MDREYWLRQDVQKPLFQDILWSRPENKLIAGKLLIVGGNLHGFASVGQAYQAAVTAGIGTARVLLPDALKKTVGRVLENCEFAPSTPSGSFAVSTLDELMDSAAWADAVLLSGDFGRSSETAILLERFIAKYPGRVILTKDAVDYFFNNPVPLLARPETCIVASTAQLQKLATASHATQAITANLDLLRLVEALHNFSSSHKAIILTQHLGSTLVAVDGQVSSTKNGSVEDIWRVETAARAAVFWLQNPSKPFEGLTSAQILHTS